MVNVRHEIARSSLFGTAVLAVTMLHLGFLRPILPPPVCVALYHPTTAVWVPFLPAKCLSSVFAAYVPVPFTCPSCLSRYQELGQVLTVVFIVGSVCVSHIKRVKMLLFAWPRYFEEMHHIKAGTGTGSTEIHCTVVTFSDKNLCVGPLDHCGPSQPTNECSPAVFVRRVVFFNS